MISIVVVSGGELADWCRDAAEVRVLRGAGGGGGGVYQDDVAISAGDRCRHLPTASAHRLLVCARSQRGQRRMLRRTDDVGAETLVRIRQPRRQNVKSGEKQHKRGRLQSTAEYGKRIAIISRYGDSVNCR